MIPVNFYSILGKIQRKDFYNFSKLFMFRKLQREVCAKLIEPFDLFRMRKVSPF